MKIEFLSLERANNGQWMLQFSKDNSYPDFKWVTEEEALFIKAAQRFARNELRHTINSAMLPETADERFFTLIESLNPDHNRL
jgi:hypothetical protein